MRKVWKYMGIFLLVLLITGAIGRYVNLPVDPVKDAEKFIDRFADSWDEVWQLTAPEGIQKIPSDTEIIQALYTHKTLTDVYERENGAVVFRFSWDPPAEGFSSLEYYAKLPAEMLHSGFTAHAPWRLVQNEAGLYRWEGGGIGGKGYIIIRELRPSWFYVEAYLPT